MQKTMSAKIIDRSRWDKIFVRRRSSASEIHRESCPVYGPTRNARKICMTKNDVADIQTKENYSEVDKK